MVTGRVIGNVLKIVGYFVLLHIDTKIGSELRLLGYLISLPWYWYFKVYDVVAIMLLFGLMDLSSLLT